MANMKYASILLILVFLIVPAFASAHERRLIKINDKIYTFVVGSLNEPTYVDDKTGVDLRINLADPVDPKNFSSERMTPIVGLEKDLKVELIAGSYKKIQDFSPVYKDAGSYKSIFFPSDATTYTYRVFGKIDNTEINIPFTCVPTSENATTLEPDEKEAKLSENVTQLYHAGTFGCPRDPSKDSFPKNRDTSRNLADQIASYENGLTASLAIAVFAVLMSALSMFKPKKK